MKLLMSVRHPRTPVLALALLTVSALSISACGSASTTGGGSGSGTNSTKGPIVIGAAVGLSGPLSQYDVPPLNAAKLAIRDVNARGGVDGRKLKLVVANTQSVPNQGPAAAQQVIGEGAKILVYTSDYDYGSPAAFVGVKNHLLTLSMGCESPKCGRQGIGPTAFTYGTGTPVQGAAGADFAAKVKHWKRAYTLADNSLTYDTSMCKYFSESFNRLVPGGVVGSDIYTSPVTSVASQIARFKSLSPAPQFIELCAVTPGGETAVRQFRAAGIDVPIISGDGMDGTYWLNGVPGLTNFFVTTNGYLYGKAPHYGPDPGQNRVAAEYVKAYGALPPTTQTFDGYTMIQGIVRAIQEAHGSLDGNTLTTEMEHFTDAPLLLPTTFTTENHISVNRTESVNEVNGHGSWRFIMKLRPAYVPPINLRLG
jgi:branched-chain amino acid transport system substrate-binding protein